MADRIVIPLKEGDRVVFDEDRIEEFTEETDVDSKEIQQYRKLVLAGINQIGIVKAAGPGPALTTVLYPDGWELPVPTKYLVPAPDM